MLISPNNMNHQILGSDLVRGGGPSRVVVGLSCSKELLLFCRPWKKWHIDRLYIQTETSLLYKKTSLVPYLLEMVILPADCPDW